MSTAYFESLRWNGKTAVQNGDAFREIAFDVDPKDMKGVVRDIVSFRPHVILMPGVDRFLGQLIESVETGLRPSDRPRYVVGGYIAGDDFFSVVRDDARRRRVLGVIPIGDAVANGKLALRYNQIFSPKVATAAAPGAVYDALYALAYAAHTLDAPQLNGPSLARSFARLAVAPGDASAPKIQVGPTGIFAVMMALDAGGHVDLEGAATRIDFDAVTGNTAADFAVLCVERGEDGGMRAAESNVTFSASASRLEGLPLRCK